MRHVELDAVVRDAAAQEVYAQVMRFERYPDLAPHVRATTVHEAVPPGTGRSSWQLYFRSGLLRWTEVETFDPAALRIGFAQTEGDFDTFTGHWQFDRTGADVRVRFSAEFDFGIPSMAGILDPIAERVIRETAAWALDGLFERVSFADGLELRPPAAVPPA